MGVELLYHGGGGRSATHDYSMAGQEGFESPRETGSPKAGKIRGLKTPLFLLMSADVQRLTIFSRMGRTGEEDACPVLLIRRS